jgi:uncharacterized membrane protein (DUF485 family)
VLATFAPYFAGRQTRRRAEDIQSMGRHMARDEAALEAAHGLVRQLIAEKLKYLLPMTIVFMVSYIGLTVLAGFAREFVGTAVVGSVNLGFLLIALNYLLSWILAIAYGFIAADKFDPLSTSAATEVSRAEAMR